MNAQKKPRYTHAEMQALLREYLPKVGPIAAEAFERTMHASGGTNTAGFGVLVGVLMRMVAGAPRELFEVAEAACAATQLDFVTEGQAAPNRHYDKIVIGPPRNKGN